jgi:hypothetical protein
VEFIESSTFSKTVSSYFSDSDYAAFQAFLISDPEAGDLISGTGGFRKVYRKDEASDLTSVQKKTLKAAIDTEKKERLESKVKPIRKGKKV